MPNFLINVTTRGVKGAGAGIKRLSGSLMHLSKVAMVGAVGGALALGVAMKKASANAGIQEAAEKKLATALGHTNKKLLEQASAFQQQSKHGDEALIEMMALASNMGIAEDQIAETTQMAIGLSEALGVDMNMAMKAAAGAIQGDTNMLTRYIPELKTTTDASAKLAIVQTAANKGFEQSKELTDTMTGSMNQASMAIGDASESLGMLIAPLIKAGATMTEEFAVKAGEAFKLLDKINFKESFQNMFKDLSGFGTAILESFKAIFGLFPERFGLAFRTILPIAKKVLDSLIGGILNIGSFIFEPIIVAGKIMGVKIGNFFIDAINKIKELYNSMASFIGLAPLDITPRISEEGLSMANTRMGEFVTEMANNSIGTTEDLTTRLGEIWDEYGNKVVVVNKKIVTGDGNKNKIIAKGTDDIIKKKKELTDKELIGYAKASGSAEDAMKTVVKAESMEAVAGFIASIFKTVPFPFNAILAAGAGASVAGLMDKGLASFATGADFVTSGPQLMMVGDNLGGGREHVQVTPLSSPNLHGPQGGGSNITLNISAPLVDDTVVDTIIPAINEAIRRGETIATN